MAVRVAAVIVAAGRGMRMGGAEKKQFMELGGLPILAHTLAVFDRSPCLDHTVVAVPEADHAFCRSHVLDPLKPRKHVTLVSGGDVRQESVYMALGVLRGRADLVVIHDGVRPFVSVEAITATVDGALQHGACISAVPVGDTLKKVDGEAMVSSTLSREGVWCAQTPQSFRYEWIWQAHEKAREEGFHGTDDAALVERMGRRVRVVRGSSLNIKITTPQDLELASALLVLRQPVPSTIP